MTIILNLLTVAIRNWRVTSQVRLTNRRIAELNDFQRCCAAVRAAETIIRMEDTPLGAEAANVIERPFFYTERECLQSFYTLEDVRNEMVLGNEHTRKFMNANGITVDEERDFLFRQSFVDAMNLLILRPVAVMQPKAKKHINDTYELMRKSAKCLHSALYRLSEEQRLARQIGLSDGQGSPVPPDEDDKLYEKTSDLVQFKAE